ncbi:Hsp70 protein-domain-containing protein [Pisolithus albus]|nr:Hsp70 protein-domain-containing protein [Pisolithus albus]
MASGTAPLREFIEQSGIHLTRTYLSDLNVWADLNYFPFKVIGKAGKPYIQVGYCGGQTKEFPPEETSSVVLTEMKETIEACPGYTVNGDVVTIPAYFNNPQGQATIDAIVTSKRSVLIFDLGGGTDVSILTIEQDIVEVKATAGDTHFVQEFKRKHWKDISSDPHALRCLHTACGHAKRILSSATQIPVEVDTSSVAGSLARASTKTRQLPTVLPYELLFPPVTLWRRFKASTFRTSLPYRSVSKNVMDNNLYGKFELTGIPPPSHGVPRSEVTFDVDANGILNVSASDKTTSESNHITIMNAKKIRTSGGPYGSCIFFPQTRRPV